MQLNVGRLIEELMTYILTVETFYTAAWYPGFTPLLPGAVAPPPQQDRSHHVIP
jgi:hypothetical protein